MFSGDTLYNSLRLTELKDEINPFNLRDWFSNIYSIIKCKAVMRRKRGEEGGGQSGRLKKDIVGWGGEGGNYRNCRYKFKSEGCRCE